MKDLNNVFRLEENKIVVSLGDRGYSYEYFSDNGVELKLNGDWLYIVTRSDVLDVGGVENE